jgi:MFS family permease
MHTRWLIRRSLGRQFEWLWTAYAVSAVGSSLGFSALPLIAIIVLHSGPTEVSVLSAAGLAVGAVAAVPLGPWVEFRRKRPVMVAMDLTRFAVQLTVPIAYAFGVLTFAQLLVVSVIVAAASIAFKTASGSYLKTLVPADDLLTANARFESTTWTTTTLGPALGGLMIGVFGPVVTVIADAVSYLLSAAGISAIKGAEDHHPERTEVSRLRASDLFDGWRYILRSDALRPLFFNSVLVNGLIMVTLPLMSVLMLDHLGFKAWQYGFAFGAPCIGGLIGSRLSRRLVARFGQHRVMLATGVLRTCFPIGLAFVGRGAAGIALIVGVQLGLVTCIGVYSPVSATYRLNHTAKDRVARTLSAWSVTSNLTVAALTALWGVLAGIAGPRTAIGIAGILIMGTSLLLPRRDHPLQPEPETAMLSQAGPNAAASATQVTR